MNLFTNLDLLSLGIAIAAIGTMGFAVYFSKPESRTNRSFFLFSIVTVAWGIVNFFSYQFSDPKTTLWLFRAIMFFAVFQAFFFHRLFTVFPEDTLRVGKMYRFIVVPMTLLVALVTLTPLVFSAISGNVTRGEVAHVTEGPGIILFAVLSVGLVIAGLVNLVRKAIRAKGRARKPYLIILTGTVIMFSLILVFNFALPVFFNNPRYIPLGALFILPFVFLTAYAIYKHKVFNIKVAATASLAFLLSAVTFLEIIFSNDFTQTIYRSSIFLLVLIFGILIIRSVHKEVAQREQIQKLAEELEEANLRLKELDRQKSEFVSIASHQLRSPLTAMKGYSSMLLEGSFGALGDKAREAVDRIFQSSQRLVVIIEDFLNLSRIEQGRMQYEFATVELRSLVETVVKEMEATAKNENLYLRFENDGKNYNITADAGKVRQVVSNVIDNAIKYTEVGGITISVQKDETTRKVLLSVKDTGIGVKAEVIPKLFQKFTRDKDAGKVNIMGTGLGLYVAKEIMIAHRGNIWVDSDGPGKGSTFYLEFMGE